ncbi:MAG TPA: acyltransferase family protein, partial [Burkholderiales bacterium]|nr:acyltransferase family protein [Burkholderiales bacterium]
MPLSDSRSAYRADIDGLRAVAVIPVVFYHAGFEWFSGGYVGVDVFLVISGFLITSIIIDEIRHDAFRVSQFYVRRARRLFPALFTVVLASSAVALLLLMPQELEDFGESVATTAVFASNFLFSSEAGYFDGPAELKPLLHTWSLAIEEQYYLLFPGFLVLLKRHGGARFIAATFAVFAVSLITSVLSVAYAPDAAFYLLPSRTWELLLGSLLALAPPFRPGRGAREALAITGLVLIVCAVFGFSSLTPFPGAAALVPCAGTAMVIAAGMHTDTPTRSGRALSLRPLVFIGLCSYSLYLWHWPILVFAKHYLLRPLAPAEALALVAASMLIAVASWRFVERPFRGAKGWFSTRGLFRFSAALIAAAVVVGLVYDTRNGLPARLPKQVRAIAAMSNDKPPERRHCEGISPAEVRFERLCRVSNLEVAPSFVLWGDSHAMAALPAMRAASLHLGRNGLLAASNGCVPLLGVSRPGADPGFECVAFNAAVLRVIEAHPELTTVILHARWARHAEGTGYADEGGETL